MINLNTVLTISTLLVTVSLSALAEPTYKADVPESLLTPDSAQSKYLGALNFVDGFPTKETIKNAYDFLDTSRAVQLFEAGMPTASMYAMLHGQSAIGVKANNISSDGNEFNYIVRSYGASQKIIDEVINPIKPKVVN